MSRHDEVARRVIDGGAGGGGPPAHAAGVRYDGRATRDDDDARGERRSPPGRPPGPGLARAQDGTS